MFSVGNVCTRSSKSPKSTRVTSPTPKVTRYPCQFCPASFRIRASLIRHRIYECEGDAKFATTEKKLMRKKPAKSTLLVSKVSKQKHNCPGCGKDYASVTSLWRHRKYECGVEPRFNCPMCKVKFAQKGNLSRHMKALHPEIKIENE